jgi:hypothetical protein
MLVKRGVYEQAGGFDPNVFMYGEEIEWCRRARDRGWTIAFSPNARVLHLNHRSADLLMGNAGRVDRCLIAEEHLLARWEGRHAPVVAGFLRILGALLRLGLFAPRFLFRRDAYSRAVINEAKEILGHYVRRVRGTAVGQA